MPAAIKAMFAVATFNFQGRSYKIRLETKGTAYKVDYTRWLDFACGIRGSYNSWFACWDINFSFDGDGNTRLTEEQKAAWVASGEAVEIL